MAMRIDSSPDLRSFLSEVQRELPEHLLTISEELPLDFTSTALALALAEEGRSPILFLRHLGGQRHPLVANLFASRATLARSIGATPQTINSRLEACLDSLLPAKQVGGGPVQEIALSGEAADVRQLPVPRHFAEDAGPYITAGMIAANDPDTGITNLAYARLQVKGPRHLGASLHSRQHLWDFHRRAEARGHDLPVAVIIGAHPAVMVAAAAKLGIDQSEYDLAGALLGEPLPLCPARTVPVAVPANAEIVIEGNLLANVREPEGPFGEYTGYATSRSTNNVLQVTAITMRKDAIYVDIVPGNSSEHLTLGRASKEAWVHRRMREALPFFVDLHYPTSGTHFHAYVRIDKTAEGQPQQAAQLLLGLDHYVKLVVVVDQDIDPSNEQEVLWALATRMQADRDVAIIAHSLCNQLDPSSQNGVGAKMIVDATTALGSHSERISLPPGIAEAARDLLQRLRRPGV